MLLQKDSSTHRGVGVDVGYMTKGIWIVKGVMFFRKITFFQLK